MAEVMSSSAANGTGDNVVLETASLASDLGNKKTPFKADFAKYLVNNYVRQEVERTNWKALARTGFVLEERDNNGLPKEKPFVSVEPPKDFSVGIIGAGIAGLYTALICQKLKIKWHIIEANPERLGGRLYTKYLSASGEEKKTHDYYDIGAMRYPYTPVMQRTFQLFDMTRTEVGDYLMKSEDKTTEPNVNPPAEKAPSRYNDITLFRETEVRKDPFKVSKAKQGSVPDDAVANPDLILNGAYDRFRDRIKNAYKTQQPGDQKAAWDYLLKHDRFSLRDYLTFVEGEEFEATHWLETLNAGTGWFDQAFSEHVLESLAFDYYTEEELQKAKEENEKQKLRNGLPDFIKSLIPDVPLGIDSRFVKGQWYYIQNGSTSLVMNTMRKIEELSIKEDGTHKINAEYPWVDPSEDFKYVMGQISMGKRVVKIGKKESYSQRKPLIVTYVNDQGPPGTPDSLEFDVVINTTTLSAMQKMDLIDLELPYDTKAAIRMLRYDTSTKVAIRFKTRWWYNDGHNLPFQLNIRGGLGKTDMPLRTCVYPSYNVDDPTDSNTFVLLCSYTWGADSERIAAMIKGMKEAGGSATDELAVVMLDNLARLHTKTKKEYQALLEYITNDLEVYHAYDWSNDPYTCGGAFALYSAHQFSRLYPALVRPLADSRLHIVGEAASAHHAWVVGALDSAARGLHNAFSRFRYQGLINALEEHFGKVGEIDKETLHIQIALGMLSDKDKNVAAPAA